MPFHTYDERGINGLLAHSQRGLESCVTRDSKDSVLNDTGGAGEGGGSTSDYAMIPPISFLYPLLLVCFFNQFFDCSRQLKTGYEQMPSLA